MLVTPVGMAGSATPNKPLDPGDVMGGGETISAITTAGAGTLTGAAIAAGILRRTGPGGGFTDTTDTANNILLALAGNSPAGAVKPGTTFRLRYINTVAFAMTFAAGAGVVAGIGTLGVAASLVRDYLLTVVNATPEVAISTNTFTTTAITFNFAPGQTGLPLGTLTPGMVVTAGANITAGTTLIGITTGPGGITGATLSAAATGTGTQSNTYSPQIKIDGLSAMTL